MQKEQKSILSYKIRSGAAMGLYYVSSSVLTRFQFELRYLFEHLSYYIDKEIN